MLVRDITTGEKDQYNSIVYHPLQSYEWGEFRQRSGIKVVRKGFFEGENLISGFQVTIHRVPHTNYTIGYVPKGNEPTKRMIEELMQIGEHNNCIYIQLEPNVYKEQQAENIDQLALTPSFHPLFTKYTFMLDLTQSEEELLRHTHPKTRYNIKVAQKHDVKIVEDNSAEAFEIYWNIMEETTTRQKFYAHTKQYHQLQWDIFAKRKNTVETNQLGYHLFLAKYKKKTLAAWVLFTFHDTLYYPYGSSRNEHRETMASNLMMWEAIKFGKKIGLKRFDMWGALGKDSDTSDPWYGFHRFKQGYGPDLVEFIGSYDLVIKPLVYQGMKLADKLRWLYLHIKK